jgi:putative oxidoreductase
MNNIQLNKFGPLPIRILVGISLILHGLPKVSDFPGTQDFFAKIGLPSDLAILIALLEVTGGFAICLGF